MNTPSALFLMVSSLLNIVTLVAKAEDASPRFLDGLDDVPLIADLKPQEDPLIFDKPGGSVVRLEMIGSQSPDSYYKGYEEALTAFGWTCQRPVQSSGLRCRKTDQSRLLEIKAATTAPQITRVILKIDPAKTSR